MNHDYSKDPPGIPLVVQVGFAGKRFPYDAAKHPGMDDGQFQIDLEECLATTLRNLRTELKLGENHFFCGISQVAIGADTAFTRACHRLHGESVERHGGSGPGDFTQRIFLPQPTEAFLTARSASGTPDFSPEQAEEARALLKMGHIAEVRPVSVSVDRTEQFEDAILELARVSDVCVAVISAEDAAKRATPHAKHAAAAVTGSTCDLLDSAATRNRPVLVITVSIENGRAAFHREWHWNFPGKAQKKPGGCGSLWKWIKRLCGDAGRDRKKKEFHPPALPAVLDGCNVPKGGEYAEAVKNFAGEKARRHQWLFVRAAVIIIGTHVTATCLAVIGLCFGSEHEPAAPHVIEWMKWVAPAKPWLLGIEVGLLFIGWLVHFGLHRAHAVRKWAISRLIAEAARSVTHTNGARGYLGHFFTLPMPEFLRPLLRTLNYFHLCRTRSLHSGDWRQRRWDYIRKRLAAKHGGQIGYYTRERDKARRWLRCATIVFWIGTLCAIAATLFECLMHFHRHMPDWLAASEEWLPVFSIFLPVVSVAALSLAASFDFEARLHTYSEMVDFLRTQRRFLARAKSDHEFAALVLQTETRLVGEHVNWFSRRAFTSVA